MLLPLFYLPSRPGSGISFRQPNIADAMRFNKIDEGEEERQTTAYLNVLQEPNGQSDARLWTAQDRRTALWWIYTGSHDSPVETFTYKCRHCGGDHYHDCDMNDLAGEIEILESDPFIDGVKINADGKPYEWRLMPLDGRAVELLEMRRAALPEEGDEGYQDALIDLRLWEFTYQCEIYHDVEGTWEDQADRRFSVISSMAVSTEFMQLAGGIRAMQEQLMHGLPIRTDQGISMLRLPPHSCPSPLDKEATENAFTRLWVRFRPVFFIPQLGLERLSQLSEQPGFVWGYSSGRRQADD